MNDCSGQLGEIDDAYLERELATIKAQQTAAERRLTAEPLELFKPPTADDLEETCAAIERWIAGAHDEMQLLADALRLDVKPRLIRLRSPVGYLLPHPEQSVRCSCSGRPTPRALAVLTTHLRDT